MQKKNPLWTKKPHLGGLWDYTGSSKKPLIPPVRYNKNPCGMNTHHHHHHHCNPPLWTTPPPPPPALDTPPGLAQALQSNKAICHHE